MAWRYCQYPLSQPCDRWQWSRLRRDYFERRQEVIDSGVERIGISPTEADDSLSVDDKEGTGAPLFILPVDTVEPNGAIACESSQLHPPGQEEGLVVQATLSRSGTRRNPPLANCQKWPFDCR